MKLLIVGLLVLLSIVAFTNASFSENDVAPLEDELSAADQISELNDSDGSSDRNKRSPNPGKNKGGKKPRPRPIPIPFPFPFPFPAPAPGPYPYPQYPQSQYYGK